MGEHLHLQPIQDKAMAFLKAEILAGRTEVLRHKNILEKLSHGAHADILSLFEGAKIMPTGPGTTACFTEFSCPGANCTNYPVFMAYTPIVPPHPQSLANIYYPRCPATYLVKK